MKSKLHPLTKIVVVICLTSCSLLYQQSSILIGLVFLSIYLMLTIRLEYEGFARLLKQLRNLLPVIISIFILQLLFDKQGAIIYRFSIIHITQHGFDTAVQVTLRLLIIIFSAVYLSRLTIRDYLNAFRLMHLPEALAVMTAITIGFIPLLTAQIKCSRQQIGLRGIDVKKLSLKGRLGLYLAMVMPVLGKTLSRVKYQAIALDLRGFRNSAKHSCYQRKALSGLDWTVICLSALLLLLPAV